MDRGAIPGLRGPDEEGILERPAVHEELGAPAGGLRIGRALDESVDPEGARRIRHRNQRARPARAPQTPRQALLRRLLGRHGQTAAHRPRAARSPTPGCASASVTTASCDARVSLAAERRNFRRAGVLKKSARTATVVPALPRGVGHPVEPAAGDA